MTLVDFTLKNAQSRRDVFRAIEAWDNDWLREHFPVPLTAKWFHEHSTEARRVIDTPEALPLTLKRGKRK